MRTKRKTPSDFQRLTNRKWRAESETNRISINISLIENEIVNDISIKYTTILKQMLILVGQRL